MKKIIASVLVFMSVLGAIGSTAFASKECSCKPCKCETCKCPSK